MHDAVAYRIGRADRFGQYETTNDAEHTYICQLAVDTLDLVTNAGTPAGDAMLVVAETSSPSTAWISAISKWS